LSLGEAIKSAASYSEETSADYYKKLASKQLKRLFLDLFLEEVYD